MLIVGAGTRKDRRHRLAMAADRLATVLERSGEDRLHPPEALREMARYELELAAADVAAYTFGT